MIGKVIPDRGQKKTKAAHIRDLTNYVRDLSGPNQSEHCADSKLDCEKVLFCGSRGFVCDDFVSQQEEMVALSHECVRSKNPIKHFMLSWQEGEQPTRDQVEESVDIVLGQMGLSKHQCQWALHHDTHNIHVHIVVNTVHPDTSKVVKPNAGWVIEGMHKSVAIIESRQGWRREKNGRYEVNAEGTTVRSEKAGHVSTSQTEKQPSQHAQDMEARIGEKSAQRIAIERAGPILKTAKTWAELHSELALVGMTYERQGSGAVIFVDDIPVKASTADRAGSIAQLQKRLGPFESRTQEAPSVYFNHKITNEIKDIVDAERRPENGLRKLSECSLATGFGTEKRAGVLQIDARPGRRVPEPVRWEPATTGGGNAGEHAEREFATPATTGAVGRGGSATDRLALARRRGHGSGGPPDPRRARREPELIACQNREVPTGAWNAYARSRREHYALKKSEFEVLRTLHLAQRQALASAQRAERTDLFKGSWQGRRDALNALRSIVAAEHVKARLNMNDRLKVERADLRAKHRPYPDFEAWLKSRGGPENQEQARAWRYKKYADEMANLDQSLIGEYIKPKKMDLRDYTSVIDGPLVYYVDAAGKRALTDSGGRITVYDVTSESAILAGLQLAKQKWGGVTIDETSSKEFKELVVKVAAEHGFTLKNPDLQSKVESLARAATLEHVARFKAHMQAPQVAVQPAAAAAPAVPVPVPTEAQELRARLVASREIQQRQQAQQVKPVVERPRG